MIDLRQTDDASFEADVLSSPRLTLVDFWAEWCAPCHALTPVLAALAEEHKGQLDVFKLDVESSLEVPARYSVRGLPALILFKQGEPVERLAGAPPKKALLAAIRRHL